MKVAQKMAEKQKLAIPIVIEEHYQTVLKAIEEISTLHLRRYCYYRGKETTHKEVIQKLKQDGFGVTEGSWLNYTITW